MLLEWGDVGSPHGNSFHGAYFGAETGGGPGIRWDPVEIRWRYDGDPMEIVPGGFRLRSGQFSGLEEIVGKRDF